MINNTKILDFYYYETFWHIVIYTLLAALLFLVSSLWLSYLGWFPFSMLAWTLLFSPLVGFSIPIISTLLQNVFYTFTTFFRSFIHALNFITSLITLILAKTYLLNSDELKSSHKLYYRMLIFFLFLPVIVGLLVFLLSHNFPGLLLFTNPLKNALLLCATVLLAELVLPLLIAFFLITLNIAKTIPEQFAEFFSTVFDIFLQVCQKALTLFLMTRECLTSLYFSAAPDRNPYHIDWSSKTLLNNCIRKTFTKGLLTLKKNQHSALEFFKFPFVMAYYNCTSNSTENAIKQYRDSINVELQNKNNLKNNMEAEKMEENSY